MTGEMREDRELENRFRTVFELATVGMAIANFQGQFIETNQAFRDILGYTEEELQNLSCIELTHPEDKAENIKLLREMLAEKRDRFTMEKRYLRKDGSVVWVNLSTTLVRDGNGLPEYAIASIQDISDAYRELDLRKQAELELQKNREQLEQRVRERTAELAQANIHLQQEIAERKLLMEALKENEQCLKAVLDAVPGSVSWISGEGQYLGVNQHLAKTLKLSSEDFTGKYLGFLNNSPQFVDFMKEFLHNNAQTSQEIFEIIVDGLTRYYLIKSIRKDLKLL